MPTRASTARLNARARGRRTFDILLIAGSEPLDAASLRNALVVTFEQRQQQPLPSSFPPPPTSWEEPYRRLASEVEGEPALDKAFAETAAFLDPILADHANGEWDPRRQTWR